MVHDAAPPEPTPVAAPTGEPTRPVAPGSSGEATATDRTPLATARVRRRRPAVGRAALVLVAVVGGATLFLSGFALGALRSSTPGTAADEQVAFQPFWDAYRAVTQDYAGEPVDRKILVDGAIKGHDRLARRPLLDVPLAGRVPALAPGAVGRRSRASGRTSRCAGRAGPGRAPSSAGGCSLVVVEPIAGGPRREGRASVPVT